MDQKTFEELLKDGDIDLILMDGGSHLTKEQMSRVREVAKQQSQERLLEMAQQLAMTPGYRDFIMMPLIGSIMAGRRKPVQEPSSEPKEEKQETPSAKKVSKDPNFTKVSAGVARPLKAEDTQADLLGKIYNFMRMDYATYLKGMRADKKYNAKLESIKEDRNKELIDLFSGKKTEKQKKDLLKQKKEVDKKTKEVEKPAKKPSESEVKTKAKTEAKTKAKTEAKTETKTTSKAETKAETKTAAKTETKAPETKQVEAPKVEAPKVETATKITPKNAVDTATKAIEKPVSSGISTATKIGAGAAAAALILPSSSIAGVIDNAAKTVGVDTSLMYAMAKQESGFNPNAAAKTSSAKGLYQFIDSTWKSMVQKYGSKYPILKERDATDPEANALAGALFIKENSEALRKAGIPINATNIYAAHFLGAGGAKTLLSADPNKKAAEVLPQAAAANKFIFYDYTNKNPDINKPRTVAQVVQVLYEKVGKYQDQYASILGETPSLAQSNNSGSQLYAASGDNRNLKQKPASGGVNVAVLNNNNTVVNGSSVYQSPDVPSTSVINRQYKS